MIYLNNAATSYPKPPSVITAMTEALETVPESSQRSSFPSSSDTLPSLRRQKIASISPAEPPMPSIVSLVVWAPSM